MGLRFFSGWVARALAKNAKDVRLEIWDENDDNIVVVFKVTCPPYETREYYGHVTSMFRKTVDVGDDVNAR